MLRGSIESVAEKRKNFLFGMEITIPCMLQLAIRISKKMTVMLLLEGLHHRTTGMGATSYFKEVEQRLNNGILVEEIGIELFQVKVMN